MKTTVRRGNGSVRGYIIESGDRKTVHDPSGGVLGYYVISQNKTFNKSGAAIGFGEQLSILFEN